jgi:hypothetical protein
VDRRPDGRCRRVSTCRINRSESLWNCVLCGGSVIAPSVFRGDDERLGCVGSQSRGVGRSGQPPPVAGSPCWRRSDRRQAAGSVEELR